MLDKSLKNIQVCSNAYSNKELGSDLMTRWVSVRTLAPGLYSVEGLRFEPLPLIITFYQHRLPCCTSWLSLILSNRHFTTETGR